MKDCLFCRIIAREIPSYIVYEDNDTIAFLDIFGATDGHTMVIPKSHGATILEFTPEDLKAVFSTVKRISAALEQAYDTKILSIGINHGEPAGVKHLHVHIMPRYEGDNGGIMQTLPGKKLTDKDFSSVAGKIRSFVQR